MDAFLRFLDADIQNNLEKLVHSTFNKERSIAGMDVNIDDEIGDDE